MRSSVKTAKYNVSTTNGIFGWSCGDMSTTDGKMALIGLSHTLTRIKRTFVRHPDHASLGLIKSPETLDFIAFADLRLKKNKPKVNQS